MAATETATPAGVDATFDFRVMASAARILVRGLPAEDAAAAAMATGELLTHLEHRWSRFRPDSDLSHLNAAHGEPVEVHPDTVLLVRTMLVAAGRASGCWDPTLLDPLEAAGYVHSIGWDGRVTPSSPNGATQQGDRGSARGLLAMITIDPEAGTVALPPGLRLDPGGIGKGLAADLAVGELRARGATGALVSIGGDLRVDGTGTDPHGWPIAVEDPFDPSRSTTSVTIDGGGVATSSTRSRRWETDAGSHHHVIDPRTRRPSTTDLATCTVIAPTGWEAEVHATEALLQGSHLAISHLDDLGLSGIAVDLDGGFHCTRDLGGEPT